jgi:Ca2+-binding EF-hand superfamily protein
MFDNKPTRLLCAISLALAGGLLVSQGALAHGGMMDHDMMEKMDANHDGMISAAEHAAFARTMFDTMDANHDGMLSKAELGSAHGMHHEHGDSDEHEKDEQHEHAKNEHEEHEHEDHDEHEHSDSKHMHHDMMAELDTNHDGMISAAEHADHMKAMFDAADANHDGMLSKDEIKAAHEMREEKREHHEGMKEEREDRKESKKDDDDKPPVKAPGSSG